MVFSKSETSNFNILDDGIIIGRFSEKELRDKAFEAFCKGGD